VRVEHQISPKLTFGPFNFRTVIGIRVSASGRPQPCITLSKVDKTPPKVGYGDLSTAEEKV